MRKIYVMMASLVALLVLGGCSSDVFNFGKDDFRGTYSDDLGTPISSYLAGEDNFSEYVALLRYADMFNALNQSSSGTSFTAFAPDNDAMHAFYASRGVSSCEELGKDYARQFVLYHTVKDSILAENFVAMKSVTNLSGDVLPVSIDAVNAGQASIGDGHITQMGISAFNGKIYVLNKAMTPLVETVYDRLRDAGTSSIMLQAIDASGFAHELQTVRDTVRDAESGEPVVRSYDNTLLNVTDETFRQNGINSYSDLQARLRATAGETVSDDSLMREYVGYHILANSREAIAASMASAGTASSLLDTRAQNQVIAVSYDSLATDVSKQLTLNADGTAASFLTAGEQKAKNGWVCPVSSWLPVWEPAQTAVVWDLADNSDIRSLVPADSYQPSEPTSTEQRFRIATAPCFTFQMGESGTKNHSYSDIDYVTCRSNLKGARNYDRVVFNLGYMGSVSMRTPTLVRGKYKVQMSIVYLVTNNFMRQQTAGNGGMLKLGFDDDDRFTTFASPYTKVPSPLPGVYTSTVYDEITFDRTASHQFNMVFMDPAASSNANFSIQIDCITFTPIE